MYGTAIDRSSAMPEPVKRLIELSHIRASIPEGLRASACEHGSRSIRNAFLRLADRIEAGGVPEGMSVGDMETIVAASLMVDDNTSDEYGSHDVSHVTADDLVTGLGGNILNWTENLRALDQAVRQVYINIYIGLTFLFVGGFVNAIMVKIVQAPMRDMIEEYQLNMGYEVELFYNCNLWVGPITMTVALIGLLVLILSRFGPFRSVMEPIVYNAPVVGRVLRCAPMAVMCETIGRLLGAGIEPSMALDKTVVLVSSASIRGWLRRASLALTRGGEIFDTIKYLPVQGDILPALVGPLGPSPSRPRIGWRLAADYFREAALRGSVGSQLLLPVFSILAAMIGWLGMSAAFFLPLMSMLSSLGGW